MCGMCLTNHERREAARATCTTLWPPTPNLIGRKSVIFLWGSISIFAIRVPIENPKKNPILEKMARLRPCRANRTRILPSLEFRPKMSLSQLASRQAPAASPHRHEFDVCGVSDKPRGPRAPRRHQRGPGPADVDLDRSESDAFSPGSISIFTIRVFKGNPLETGKKWLA